MDEQKDDKIENISTLKKEYFNPAEKISEFFQFLSSFKVVDLKCKIRFIVNEIKTRLNHKPHIKRYGGTQQI